MILSLWLRKYNYEQMKKKIYILGIGHNTPVIIELAELNGYEVAGLYHHESGREGDSMCGVEVIGSNDDLFNKQNIAGENFALSMGNNAVRVELANKLRERGGVIPSLIHPTASVSKYTQIEEGVIVQSNATIQPDVLIKKDTVISFNVGVSHNAIIDEGCYIACQTVIGAYTHIKEMAFVGMGVTIVSAKVPIIGMQAFVGAGSVVVKSVEDFQVVAGNPAKPITKNNHV